MRKKRPVRVLFAAIALMVFYFILFPYPLGRELVAHPRWAIPVPTASGTMPSGAQGTPAPFQLGNLFGYVEGDGTVLYAGATPYRVALSAGGFVTYTRLGTDWILQDPSGRRVTTFSGSGYPLLGPSGSRLFNVKSDLSGIIELDHGGGLLWERDFPTMMTTASVQGDLLFVGLLGGSLQLLDGTGQPVFVLSPGGSRIPVVVGAAVAPDGSLLAAVTGIGPQYLTVLRRQTASSRSASYGPIAVLGLPSEYRREIRMGFSPDSRFLVLEGMNAAGIFDPAGATLRWAGLRGTLAGMAWPGGGRLAALAGRDGAEAELVIEPPSGVVVCREQFPARELSLATIDGQLLLGWDGQLLRIDVEPL